MRVTNGEYIRECLLRDLNSIRGSWIAEKLVRGGPLLELASLDNHTHTYETNQ
jgi:hypothetical protein